MKMEVNEFSLTYQGQGRRDRGREEGRREEGEERGRERRVERREQRACQHPSKWTNRTAPPRAHQIKTTRVPVIHITMAASIALGLLK